MVVYNFFHLETSSSTVCQRMALAVLAYFPLEYLGWKFLDYLSTGCVYFGNVSVDRAKIVLQYLHSDRNYSNFWVNGKQPMCLANSWETASSRDGAVLPGVVTTAARGNPFPMPLAIVTKSKMNQEMDKSNAQKQQTNTPAQHALKAGIYCQYRFKKEPPPIRVTCGQELCTEIIHTVLQTSARRI